MTSALGLQKKNTRKFLKARRFVRANCSRFGSHSENHLKNFEHRSIYLCTIPPLRMVIIKIPENFFDITELILALYSRFGPLPLLTNLAGSPPGTNQPLSGSDGYHDKVGTPPLSIASDTCRSSPRTPHQCKTLARSQAPRTPSPTCSSARGIAQLHVKGVLRTVSSSETSDTPPLRTEIRVIKAITTPQQQRYPELA